MVRQVSRPIVMLTVRETKTTFIQETKTIQRGAAHTPIPKPTTGIEENNHSGKKSRMMRQDKRRMTIGIPVTPFKVTDDTTVRTIRADREDVFAETILIKATIRPNGRRGRIKRIGVTPN